MGSLLTSVLPLALGAAVSPLILTLVVLILAGRTKPVLRGWVFTAGVAVVLVGYSFVGAKLLHLGQSDPSKHSVSSGVIRLVATVLLLLLGIRALRSKSDRSGALMKRMDSARTSEFFVIGMLTMVANFTSIVLFLPALHDIDHADVSSTDKLLAYAMLVAITLLPALVPVLIATLLGPRGQPMLDALNRFVTAHSRQINAGICFVFALYLGYQGIIQFTPS